MVDVVMAVVGASASSALAGRYGTSSGAFGWTIAATVLALAFIAGRGGYRFRLRVSALDDLGRIMTGTAIAAMLIIAGREVLSPGPEVASESVRLWACLTVSLGVGRMGASLSRARSLGLNTLVIGAGHVGRTIARRLDERPGLGLTPIGFLDEDPLEDRSNQGPPVLGAIPDLEEVVGTLGVEHVVVAFSRAPHSVLLGVVRRCRALGIEVSLVPRLFEEVSGRVSVEHLGSVALLRVDRVDPRGWQFEVKYLVDRLLSAIAVILLAPILLLIALLVKLSSPGSVLFRQPRVGLDGKEFDLLKFRTMRDDPEAPQHNEAWAIRALGHEAPSGEEISDRRTSLGKFLRTYSLDEFPQLFNVLKGEMSLVGPRPLPRYHHEDLPERVRDLRERVRPGITGLWQVSGRSDAGNVGMERWDPYYVRNWSLWLDAVILVRTVQVVLKGSGAY